MKLNRQMWSSFRPYLFIDQKLSDKKQNAYALKSCFLKMADRFSDIPFTRENFTQFMSDLKDKGHSPTYLNNLVKMAKHVERFLQGKGLIEELTLQDYKYFKISKLQTKEIIAPDEIEKLANVYIPYDKFPKETNLRQKALILLLGETGCRIGEALNLLNRDVLDSPRFSVTFRDTKNGSDRTVPISEHLYKLLKEAASEREYIFYSYRGELLTEGQNNLDLKRRAMAIGLKKRIYNHLFRHSYCTTMAQSGVSILDLGKLVGHKSPEVTMRYYNADLEYLSGVILQHPLLKKEISFEAIKTNLRNSVVKITANSKYQPLIKEDKDVIVISLIK